MLFGQMITADQSRHPQEPKRMFYTHLPRGVSDDASAERIAETVDQVLEQHAPGFTDRVIGTTILRPFDLEVSDANLHIGAVNGGTSQPHQQLIFRPAPGFGQAETPVETSISAAPAPRPVAVHGICGRNAARAALASDGALGWPRRRLNRAVMSRATRSDSANGRSLCRLHHRADSRHQPVHAISQPSPSEPLLIKCSAATTPLPMGRPADAASSLLARCHADHDGVGLQCFAVGDPAQVMRTVQAGAGNLKALAAKNR